MHTNMAASSSGHSPTIEMMLDVDGQQFTVMEVGPGYLVVQPDIAVDPTQGILSIAVDGQIVRRQIALPEGIRSLQEHQPFVVLQTFAPTYSASAG